MMKKLCEWTLYRPGSDSFSSAERFRINPVCPRAVSVTKTDIYNKTNIVLSFGWYENMKYMKHNLQIGILFGR